MNEVKYRYIFHTTEENLDHRCITKVSQMLKHPAKIKTVKLAKNVKIIKKLKS